MRTILSRQHILGKRPNPEETFNYPKVGKCTNYLEFYDKLTIEDGKPACIAIGPGSGLYFGEHSVSVKGKTAKSVDTGFSDPVDIGSSSDVKVLTCSNVTTLTEEEANEFCFYEITSKSKITITPLNFGYYYGESEIPEQNLKIKMNTRFIAKNKFEGDISVYVDKKEKKTEGNFLVLFNPNNQKITASKNENAFLDGAKFVEKDGSYVADSVGMEVYLFANIKQEDAEKVDETLEYKIEGKGNEIKFNEIAVDLEPLKFYSEDDLFSSGLSGGAIAGIVIGVLAGVGLIGFCVYWFVFRKKSSSSSSSSKKSGSDKAEV